MYRTGECFHLHLNRRVRSLFLSGFISFSVPEEAPKPFELPGSSLKTTAKTVPAWLLAHNITTADTFIVLLMGVRPSGHIFQKFCLSRIGWSILVQEWNRATLSMWFEFSTLASPPCRMGMVRQAWIMPERPLTERCYSNGIGLKGTVDLRLIPVYVVTPGSFRGQLLCSTPW